MINYNFIFYPCHLVRLFLLCVEIAISFSVDSNSKCSCVRENA
jgi:hypothetical protein